MGNDAMRDTIGLPDIKRFIEGLGSIGAMGESPSAPFFARGQEILVSRAPGRLDLMGGNDDYTGGLVFEATIREAVMVAAQGRLDRRVVFYNPAVKGLGWEDRIELSLDDLEEDGGLKPVAWVRSWCEKDPRRSWCAYILGDLYFLMKNYPRKIEKGLQPLSRIRHSPGEGRILVRGHRGRADEGDSRPL